MPITFPHVYLFKPVSESCRTKKRARGLCRHWCCSRPHRYQATDCETCHARKRRLSNGERYAYSNLRSSARKRGIGFELSFKEFQDFVTGTGYIERRGKDPESLSIDRIRNAEPYRLGNLRIATYELNVTHKIEGLEAVTPDF